MMENNLQTVLELKNITKIFGENHVLNGFNLKLVEGESLVIMGKSGSGKSVMVKCLVGLIKPDTGTITIKGEDITSMEHKELDILRNEIGFLFQGSALYDSMTVRENLEFPLRRRKDQSDHFTETETLVTEALKDVGLEQTIDLMPSELSGGMQRRIALARALILKPKIMIYDEPTTGLDPITAKEIIELLRNIQLKYKTSSIIITHDVDCARVISSRMILLVDGVNYAEGTFQELSNSDDPQIKAFFKN
ncbi:ATP-binding cassette domain-containing protein [Chryseobacterium chendengshani]|uniref:ABC transporter ATP-binding protein n=1 Tax=Chryseobacterium sp. LJ668 TaxID=2864040 RepID=UPI001C68AE44|nr:ATP-binding cassette domain-containing protein [Chryseobacterium sp. LJ668]MBW8523770.1 ATP-binding cassette domain-containing protein [Chryseobacterium sp. LJ668]QYK16714.1 ATP-binding cassette domain-containing protein [Chryseobacterium sp. LJ668]